MADPAETQDENPGTDDDARGDAGGDGEKELGESGERALERAKTERNEARQALKPWRDLGRELGMTAEQVRDALKGKAGDAGKPADDAVDVDAIRREATQQANTRIVRAAVRELAADTFVNPADAPLYLNLADIDVDDDGEPDRAAVKEKLADVLKDRPHLAKKRGPRPDPSQGNGGGKPKPGTIAEILSTPVERKNTR